MKALSSASTNDDEMHLTGREFRGKLIFQESYAKKTVSIEMLAADKQKEVRRAGKAGLRRRPPAPSVPESQTVDPRTSQSV